MRHLLMIRRPTVRPVFAFFLAALLATLACGRSRTASAVSPPSSDPTIPGTSTSPMLPSSGRAMRITMETNVLVAHRDAAVASLRTTVASLGGYVSEGTLSGKDVGGSARFMVKIPAASTADFRAALSHLGDVETDTEKAEDVTEARADINARLRNARAQETRLLELLTTHTGGLADVVLLEKELAAVRESVERMEAEERTMEGQIAFATATVVLSTIYVPVDDRPGHELAVAARDGLNTAKSFVFGTLTFLLSAGPTILIVIASVYLAYRLLRAWTRRRRRVGAA